MIARLFGAMHVLGHEKRPVWYEAISEDCPVPSLCYEAWVEIPEKYHPYKTVNGDTALTLSGTTYLLSESLGYDENDDPVLKWHDGCYPHTAKLDQVKR